MTLRETTASLAAALAAAYPPPEAEAIARLVLQQQLGLSSLTFMMQAGQPVPAEVLAQLPAQQARLLAHEPVQYVLGTAHFEGMELEVSPATLIPRPETEELVRLVLADWQRQPVRGLLDVGTGSGCLVLALARALQPARALGVDISEEALAVARRNGRRYAPEVDFQRVDILTQMPAVAPGTLDVLVSNPPYVRESEKALMRDNVLAWEPATALFVPDADPLLFYRRIGALGRQLLRPGGGLYFEINEAFGQETVVLLQNQGYREVRAVDDMFGKARMVRASA
ncbi:peptide chain release factor N(5)-glutamine methyltransferase [Hymenobacter saemangeumensis]|uniref:Peptide chain release factor N(5)-glutamine methyltransferase n=1 Tax=Hymenobacter saemangeumensis TaxID=1084522 RepID=A0ABP8HYP4_9BACT